MAHKTLFCWELASDDPDIDRCVSNTYAALIAHCPDLNAELRVVPSQKKPEPLEILIERTVTKARRSLEVFEGGTLCAFVSDEMILFPACAERPYEFEMPAYFIAISNRSRLIGCSMLQLSQIMPPDDVTAIVVRGITKMAIEIRSNQWPHILHTAARIEEVLQGGIAQALNACNRPRSLHERS